MLVKAALRAQYHGQERVQMAMQLQTATLALRSVPRPRAGSNSQERFKTATRVKMATLVAFHGQAGSNGHAG